VSRFLHVNQFRFQGDLTKFNFITVPRASTALSSPNLLVEIQTRCNAFADGESVPTKLSNAIEINVAGNALRVFTANGLKASAHSARRSLLIPKGSVRTMRACRTRGKKLGRVQSRVKLVRATRANPLPRASRFRRALFSARSAALRLGNIPLESFRLRN